jgi:hypothetical protein
MKTSMALQLVLDCNDLDFEDTQIIKTAIKIVQAYETIPDGHVMTIYNPDEYMIVERVK